MNIIMSAQDPASVPGTDAASGVDWAQWQRHLGEVAIPVPAQARVLVVGAHPDDETIGAGRLVAGHDGPCTAVVLSAGERCVPHDDPAALGRVRLEEWRAAVGRLGARALDTPRWPDGELTRHEDALAELLTTLARDHDVVVCPWAHDPHPDHAAVGRAVRAAELAADVVEYPVWAPFWLTPDDVAGHGAALARVSTPVRADQRWREALAEYGSQTRPLGPGWSAVVPAELLERHAAQLVVTARD